MIFPLHPQTEIIDGHGKKKIYISRLCGMHTRKTFQVSICMQVCNDAIQYLSIYNRTNVLLQVKPTHRPLHPHVLLSGEMLPRQENRLPYRSPRTARNSQAGRSNNCRSCSLRCQGTSSSSMSCGPTAERPDSYVVSMPG